MNKFENKINEIKMDELDKKRLLANITKYENEAKNKLNINKIRNFIIKLVTVVTTAAALGTTAYAAVKIFNIDEKLSKYFGNNYDELSMYGVTGTNVSKAEETDDAIITVNQTVVDEKEIYISLDIDGKYEPIYLTETEISDTNNIFGTQSFGYALLEESGNHVGYVLTASIDGKIEENTNITIKLYMDNDKTEEITFKVSKNDMKVKEVKTNTVVYNDGNIIATVTSVRLTPLHCIFDIEYNVDLNTLDEETINKLGIELYNDECSRETYYEFKDGKTETLRLWYYGIEGMLNPYYGYEKEEPVFDIEQIESVTINGNKIMLNAE